MELSDYKITVYTSWNQSVVIQKNIALTLFAMVDNPRMAGYLSRRDGSDVRWLVAPSAALH